ncbi:CLUMA_CG020554, isoform A [Clunio marinus]|uniref:CLUMA_CG020554, isoform A n=1 Tax=Clunio marinus TaxID=568069 RepID=A0A1J1J5A3_9DIPT|nr:CLUMA_CG020554, isoform A [Clunio marinus]
MSLFRSLTHVFNEPCGENLWIGVICKQNNQCVQSLHKLISSNELINHKTFNIGNMTSTGMKICELKNVHRLLIKSH